MYISSRVHQEESCLKVAKCIYDYMFIRRKVVLKLRNAYIITCSSGQKWFQSCGMYISLRVHQEECYFKVAQCICHHVFIWWKVVFKAAESIYHHVFIRWKVVLKLRNVYIIKCSL